MHWIKKVGNESCSSRRDPMIPNSTTHCHPLGVAVGGRVWYHWMSPFETNNFHYPLFFIQCIVLEIFQCLQINGPPCIWLYYENVFESYSCLIARFRWMFQSVFVKMIGFPSGLVWGY